MKFITVALVGATAVSAASHRHMHRHAHRHASPVIKRADAVAVDTAIETVYDLKGKILSPEEAEIGIEKGLYVIIPDPTSAVPLASKIATAAEILELVPTTTSVPPKTTAPPPPPPPPPTSSSSQAAPAPVPTGIDADFPSGTIDCSHFPSDYGAIEVDWLDMGGWIGLQMTPGYTPGDKYISHINTGIAGDNCKAGTFCSYACPAGYQKAQWPTSQGNTGQSIGGLFCNSKGKLEITNPGLSKKLCITGTGEVKIKNEIDQNVPVCRTDYPGTESETVPLDTQPGQEYELTCPDANKYYRWGGAFTSGQYYINPAGAPLKDACRWNKAGSNMGNWAPLNLGVGKGPTGATYISIFRNAPTNPDGRLDYNIEITGDVSGKCEYRDGEFYNNGNKSPSGCTVLVTGTATYRIYR